MPAKTISFREWEAERMKDPAFRAACEELEPEYQAERQRIEAEIARNKKALALREKGLTYAAIARELGVSVMTAWRIVDYAKGWAALTGKG